MNPEVFREYDIRGLVDIDMTPQDVLCLARAFGTYLTSHGRREAIVGRDTRASSPSYRDAVVEGLTRSGISVLDIGEVTTPIFYYARVHLQRDGGVMITASHNPAEFNGFKMALGPSTIYGEEIQAVRRLMESEDFVDAETPGTVRHVDVVPAYMEMLAEKVRLGSRPLKVVVDCGNGTPGLFAARVMETFGVETVPLYFEPDPTFPNHHPDPVVAKNLQDLIAAVQRTRADLGIAFDGDGDRIGVVDEQGHIIWGDRLMVLYWREILARHPGSRAIVEVKCSQSLFDEIARLGGNPEFFKTGHSLIKARMRETGAIFAGEMSGHMFFADEYFGFDDAFYAAGRLLRLLSHTDAPLSQLLADLPELPNTPETRIDCPDDLKFTVVDAVSQAFQARADVETITVDGVRVIYPYGWGLIRASNTQPALVARAEADTAEHLRAITDDLTVALARFPQVPTPEWDIA